MDKVSMQYMELDDAAEFLKVSHGTLLQWMKGIGAGNFKAYTTKIGRRVIITHQNIENYLNGLDPVSHGGGKEA